MITPEDGAFVLTRASSRGRLSTVRKEASAPAQQDRVDEQQNLVDQSLRSAANGRGSEPTDPFVRLQRRVGQPLGRSRQEVDRSRLYAREVLAGRETSALRTLCVLVPEW
jgi:hypothetical protein